LAKRRSDIVSACSLDKLAETCSARHPTARPAVPSWMGLEQHGLSCRLRRRDTLFDFCNPGFVERCEVFSALLCSPAKQATKPAKAGRGVIQRVFEEIDNDDRDAG